VQITKNEIKYFQTRWDAGCWDTKSLNSISIDDIKGVYRVNMKLDSNNQQARKEKQTKNPKKLYHFEIFTNDSIIPYEDEVEREPIDQTLSLNYNAEKIQTAHFGPKFAEENGHNKLERKVNKTQLMPTPFREKKLSNAWTRGKRSKSITKKMDENPRRSISSNKRNQEVNTQKLSNPSTNRESSDTATISSIHPTRSVNFVKSKSDLSKWSGREKEWYYSEKRLLFSTYSFREREVWIAVINWLIEEKRNNPSLFVAPTGDAKPQKILKS